MRHRVGVSKVAMKTECRRDGVHRHHTRNDPTLIAKNQKDSAADFDDDGDEIGQKRKRQAGGRDEATSQRRGGYFAESTDQEKRRDENSTDRTDVGAVFQHI